MRMGLHNLSQAGITKRKGNIRNSIWTVFCCIGVLCFPLQACSGGKGKPVEGTQKQPAGTDGKAGTYTIRQRVLGEEEGISPMF